MSGPPTIPLTLIVPAFQGQAKLERTLTSLLDQDVAPREVVVVDDGSAPPLLLPRSLEARLNLRLVQHARNAGAAAARNSGLKVAQTEWVSFLDSDDRLAPQTLGLRWNALCQDQQAQPDPKVIYGCAWIDCSETGRPLLERRPRAARDPLAFASGCWFSPGSCIIMNGPAALAAAGPQDTGLRRLEDYDWFLALALRGFTLQVQPVIGAFIERRRQVEPAVVAASAEAIRRKWRRVGLAPRLAARMGAYLALEVAAANHYAGARLAALAWLARSFLYAPRLSLHPSPGWETVPASRTPLVPAATSQT